MKTSIVILTHNRLRCTRACLRSIRRFTPEPHELIVVDNGSSDGTVPFLRRQRGVYLIANPGNRGYPAACNQGLAAATGDQLLLLNNDVLATPGWLAGLTRCLQEAPEAGLVGPVTNHAAGIQRVAVPYTGLGGLRAYARRHNRPDPRTWQPTLRLIGFCLLMKRAVWERLGPLDEQFAPGNFEDDDYSLRALAAGFRLYVAGDTYVHHFGSASWSAPDHALAMGRNQRRLEDKWGLWDYRAALEAAAVLPLVPAGSRRVLEAGYGLGHVALALRHRGCPWAGLLSWDPAAAAVAARLVSPVLQAPAGEFPPAAPGGLDAVVLAGALDWCPSPPACLRAAAARLRPGGVLIGTCGNAAHYRQPAFHDWLGTLTPAVTADRWPRAYSLAQLNAWLQQAGLQVETVRGWPGPVSAQDQAALQRLAGSLGAVGLNPGALAGLWGVERFLLRARKVEQQAARGG